MKSIRFRVRIETGRHGGDVGALLDMLRYEGGRVVDWGTAGGSDDPFIVTIEVERGRFTPDRWRSFGIVTEVIL